jgi:hypothetical protein
MMSCGRSTGIDGKTTGDFGVVSVIAWSMFVICDLLGTRALALFRLLICQALVVSLNVVRGVSQELLKRVSLGVLPESSADIAAEVRGYLVELDAVGSSNSGRLLLRRGIFPRLPFGFAGKKIKRASHMTPGIRKSARSSRASLLIRRAQPVR